LGDSTKARSVLGWTPEYSFDDLVHDMCMNFD
jgi:GDP-D-mannose dehydratase